METLKTHSIPFWRDECKKWNISYLISLDEFIYLFVLGKQPSVNQLMYYRTLSTMSKLADFDVHEYMQLLKEGEDWNVRPLGLLSAHTKWSQAFSYLGEFFIFYIIFFSDLSKIYDKFYFYKNVILPPVQPAEWRYRQMNRRQVHCRKHNAGSSGERVV